MEAGATTGASTVDAATTGAAADAAARKAPFYLHLVPGSLLTPSEVAGPGGRTSRTVRDWFVDVMMFLLSAAAGLAIFSGTNHDSAGHVGLGLKILDGCAGVAACLLLWGRRRHPVGTGVATAVLSCVSASAVAALPALFSVAVRRRSGTAFALAGLNLVCATAFTIIRPQKMSLLSSTFINVAVIAVFTAWGMFVRARRQLVWSYRERAERAEAEQRILADQARLAERTRIAREMHDVLAHRISLVALHAGGLEVRPDLDPDTVRETAGLLRSTAHQALEDLRGVIGVLREEDGTTAAPSTPQPTLNDIPRLVDDSRRAGARIELDMDVPAAATAPGALGRDAYRIVQEALTNAAKHAAGTRTVVRVSGAPGDGLTVDVRNRLPVSPVTSPIPGSGSGLLGLAERVSLAGGTLRHGPTASGEFEVAARLAW